MLRRGDIFSPKVGLDAKDVLPLLRVKPLKRLVAVNFLKRKISADADWMVSTCDTRCCSSCCISSEACISIRICGFSIR